MLKMSSKDLTPPSHYGKEAQEFFKREQRDIEPHIEILSRKIVTTLREDEKLFRTESIALLREIQREAKKNAGEVSYLTQKVTELYDWKKAEPEGMGKTTPVKSGQKIQFSDYFIRSIYESSTTKRRYRQVLFRIKVIDPKSPIYNLDIKAYLLVTRFILQPDNTIGKARNWNPLYLVESDRFIPKLTNYWSFSYFIDPRRGDPESPFFLYQQNSLLRDIKIRIYLSGFDHSGKPVFGEWEYDWSKETTKFGRFKLRDPKQKAISNQRFNEIIEAPEDPNIKWPLLDIKIQ